MIYDTNFGFIVFNPNFWTSRSLIRDRLGGYLENTPKIVILCNIYVYIYRVLLSVAYRLVLFGLSQIKSDLHG